MLFLPPRVGAIAESWKPQTKHSGCELINATKKMAASSQGHIMSFDVFRLALTCGLTS